MKKRVPIVLFVMAAVSSTGCYPRYALVQPNLTLTVRDQGGEPVDEASVFFVAASNPHHMLHHKDTYITDRDGVVNLKSEREWVLDVPIMIHGVAFYYFAWCVEKRGYVPARGYLSATDVCCSHEEEITLAAGTGFGECRQEYEKIRRWGEPGPTSASGPLREDKLR